MVQIGGKGQDVQGGVNVVAGPVGLLGWHNEGGGEYLDAWSVKWGYASRVNCALAIWKQRSENDDNGRGRR